MIDLIYNFILDNLIGSTSIPNIENLAQLLTFFAIILIFLCLVSFVRWFFNIGRNIARTRR